ncbi:unnamed protein product [Linum tenue]|uniref:Pentatricopeptide repeat-containing protein-mitochondrial domain-containing protein n=1 Tax=Linum tenue TaxID=586396 RepID=A0AAV0K3S9_9ROSI|nr:unnamed protein product [Linum tenue]
MKAFCLLRNRLKPFPINNNVFRRCFSPLPIYTNTNLAHQLHFIFTKRPATSPDDPDLRALSPFLNPKLVETVLYSFQSWKLAHFFFTWASNQQGYRHNAYTFNAMASILSRARQNAPLRALSEQILRSRCPMTPGALGFFIRCLGCAGLVEEANSLFDQVQSEGLCFPNVYAYNCLLEAVSKSNCVDLVDARLKEMSDRGFVFDKYTLTPVLQVYCNAGRFDKAFDVFNMISDRGFLDGYLFSILALAFTKWGQVDKAFELIEVMEARNVGFAEKTFIVLIHGFLKQSRLDRALQLFDKMKNSGFVPDISLYDVLIGVFSTAKELDKALGLYAEMKEFNVQPDTGIITKLISCCNDEGELKRLFKEIGRDMNLEALTMLYNSLLTVLVNNDSIDKAYSLLRVMLGESCSNDLQGDEFCWENDIVPSPNASSFGVVIDGLCKAGKLDLAVGLFRDMSQKIGCKPNLLICNNLISGLCSSDRMEDSLEILREMEKSGLVPSPFTHNAIFGCLCKRMDVAGALDLIKKMRVHGHEPWIKHCTLMVKELCKHKKAVEACKFLDDVVEEGFIPDMIAYSAALDGLIRIHEVDLALELFRDIVARGNYPDVVAYNTMMKGLCQAKRVAEAEELLKEMVMKGLVPSVITYNLLIDGWCKNGSLEAAMRCLSEMFDKGREPNVITYTTLVNGLCNAGRPEEALAVWNEMVAVKGLAPGEIAFMALVHGLCKCGRPNEAVVHLREMKSREMKPDGYVYTALVSAFLAELNHPLALEMVEEMVREGRFPGKLDKNHAIARDAVIELLSDSRTCSSIRDLIAEGNIPSISMSDLESDSLDGCIT